MLKITPVRRAGFTLVEIMIVVAIIALLAAIAVPSALRARKRSQATSTLETLRAIDAATDQWAIDNHASPGQGVATFGLASYVKSGTKLYNQLNGTDLSSGTAGLATDALGNTILGTPVDSTPQVPAATFTALSDVAPSEFWGAYYSGS